MKNDPLIRNHLPVNFLICCVLLLTSSCNNEGKSTIGDQPPIKIDPTKLEIVSGSLDKDIYNANEGETVLNKG